MKEMRFSSEYGCKGFLVKDGERERRQDAFLSIGSQQVVR